MHARSSGAPVGAPRAARAWLRSVATVIGKIVASRMQAVAEARMHRTAIEIELHHGHYSHASKNDDDLPRPL